MFQKIEELLEYQLWEIPAGRILTFLVVIFSLLIVRHFIVKILVKLFRKASEKTQNKLDDKIVDICEPPFRFLMLIFVFSVSLPILKLPEVLQGTVSHLIRSMVIIGVFWTFYRGTDLIRGLLEGWTQKTQSELDDKIVSFIVRLLNIVIILIGGMVLIQEWDYNVTGIVTGLGLGGLAFALAAKDMLSNIFGLLMIIADKPFSIGDWVVVDNIEGTVEDIGFRSTKIRTFGLALVSVPNAAIASSAVINWSRRGHRRMRFNLDFTYDSTPAQIKAFTMQAEQFLQNHKEIHQETIFVKFSGFEDSSLRVFFYFFSNTAMWGEFLDVQQRVKLDLMEIALELGLSFAFPSQSIYMAQDRGKEVKRFDKEAKKYIENFNGVQHADEQTRGQMNEAGDEA